MIACIVRVQIVRKGSLSRKEIVRQVVSGWQATERRLAGVLPLGNMSSGAPYVVESIHVWPAAYFPICS